MKHQPQKIESQKELDKLLSKRNKEYPLGVFIQLNFGIRSSKEIFRNEEGNYWVLNEVDDSEEFIEHNKLMASFIGKAISMGALYKY